jgi:hypothetical protein
MSDFLANLVRRGAGLAPTVRSRPAPPTEDVDRVPSELDGTDEVSPPGADAPQSTQAATPSALPAAAPPAARDVPVAPLLSQPIAPAAAPIVQRVALPATLAPMAPPPAPLPPSPPAAALPRAADVIVVTDPSPLWRAPLTRSVAPGELAIDAHAVPVHQAASHDTVVDVRPLAPPAPGARSIDRLITNTQLIEVTRDAGRVIADISPSPVPVAPHVEWTAPSPPVIHTEPPAPETVALPERVVHVRIGAIEIHGAAAPVAVAPAAPSQPAPLAASSDTTFDRYARLRSYAPLNW